MLADYLCQRLKLWCERRIQRSVARVVISVSGRGRSRLRVASHLNRCFAGLGNVPIHTCTHTRQQRCPVGCALGYFDSDNFGVENI